MNCMKCGQEIEMNQVFCPECLADMQKYPVDPGTVIQLPAQPTEETGKKQGLRYRPNLSPEEQIKRLRKRVHNLVLALILTSLMTLFLAFLTYEILVHNNGNKLLGQNYSTVDTAETSEAGTKTPNDFGFSD